MFQLKRFKTSKYFVKKIDTFVDFPVDELDLSKYVDKGESCLYELYAVCNHDGGIGLGHYTAYAKVADFYLICFLCFLMISPFLSNTYVLYVSCR